MTVYNKFYTNISFICHVMNFRHLLVIILSQYLIIQHESYEHALTGDTTASYGHTDTALSLVHMMAIMELICVFLKLCITIRGWSLFGMWESSTYRVTYRYMINFKVLVENQHFLTDPSLLFMFTYLFGFDHNSTENTPQLNCSAVSWLKGILAMCGKLPQKCLCWG